MRSKSAPSQRGGCFQTTVVRPECTGMTVSVGTAPSLSATRCERMLSGEISETSEIIGSLYTTPDQMDVFMQTNNLHEWEGYAPYSTYQNDEGSDFEITPSVTLTPTAAAQ